jgi:hypothetical protein
MHPVHRRWREAGLRSGADTFGLPLVWSAIYMAVPTKAQLEGDLGQAVLRHLLFGEGNKGEHEALVVG